MGGVSRSGIARLNADGTPDTSFDPGTGANATVYAAAVQADGKIVAGGDFSQIRGSGYGRFVRFNPDGTLDAQFTPGEGANSSVYALMLLPNGQILIGGAFTAVGGQPRNYIARLKPNGALDPAFNLTLNASVWAMALAPDGKILLGGEFTSVSGTQRTRVARLNADGTLDDTFDPAVGPNSTVRALAVQSDGKVLLGGNFYTVNYLGINYLTRLNSDGLLDLSYGGSANNAVYALALQPDGRLLAGGEFTVLSGQTAIRLGRVLANGAADPSFDAGSGLNTTVSVLALQPDGAVLVGGGFSQFNGATANGLTRVLGLSAAAGGELEFSATDYRVSESQPNVTIEVRRNGTTTGTVSVNYATSNGTANAGDYTGQSGKLTFGPGETKKTFTIPIRADTTVEDDETVNLTLSAPTGEAVLGGQRTAVLTIVNDDVSTAVGAADTRFVGGSYGPIYAAAVQPDSKIVVVGDFAGLVGGSRVRIGRLNSDGTVDNSFNPSAWLDSPVNTVAVQPDGRILVGGSFTVVNGVTRNRLARFNSDGSLDTTFNPGAGPNSTVYTLLVQPNGDIYVGGAFSAYNGDNRGYLVRIYGDGSLDPDFKPLVNAPVWALTAAPDGRLVLGGEFTSVLGTTRVRVARLNIDGTLDLGFDPATGPNSTVRALAVQADGRVMIGGHFTSVSAVGYNYLCRLGNDGLPDLTYVGSPNNVVYALALQADGRLLVGGEFTVMDGVAASHLTRLLDNGAVDPSYDTGSGANAAVLALALQSDGNAIVGGTFTQFNGLNHIRLVRVIGASAATGGDLEFSAATYRVSEGQPTALIEVRRVGPTTGTVSVNFATSNGTANAGDYTPQSGKLTFAPGDTKKTFTIPIRADAVVEDDETVNLTLSAPAGGAALGGNRTAVLTIVNDDNTSNVGGLDTSFVSGVNGTVYSSAVQPDGKVVIVGEFGIVSGGARLRVARLNPDGTLDDDFYHGASLDSTPVVVVLQPDGRILIGGNFTVVNGVTRNRLVRLNADGTVDTTFNPGVGPNSTVYAIQVQPTGDILVGGAFSAFSGENRGYLARVYSDGSLDPQFVPQVNGPVWSLAPTADGKLLLAGDFTSVLGTSRNRVARMNADDSLDLSFDPGSGPNTTVRSVVADSGGKVLIAGNFTVVAGQGFSYLCRLNPNGLPDETYHGYANNVVYTIVRQPDGRLLVGGEFTVLSDGGTARVGRLLGNGAFDPSFDVGTGANAAVLTLSLQLDGGVIAGGTFTQFNNLSESRLTRLSGLSVSTGGELEFTAAEYRVSESQPSVTVEVRRVGPTSAAVTVNYATSNGTANAGDYTAQSGSLVFGVGETRKSFTVPIRADTLVEEDETVNLTLSNPTGGAILGGQRTALLTILNDDNTTNQGGADTTFTAAVVGSVYGSAVQSDGKVVVVGDFSGLYSGTFGEARLRVARLNVDGTLDPSFNPSAWLDSPAEVVVIQPDGRILVGGAFTVANGVTRNRLVRFNTDGSLDTSFNPGVGPNSTVYSLLVQPTGDILVGGVFSGYNGENRGYLVRIFNDGSLDSQFTPQVNSTVYTMAYGPDGRCVLGGDFTSVWGATRNRVARLNVDGSLDATFDPQQGPNTTVRTLVVQSDRKVVVGGSFGSVNGQGTAYLARLNADGSLDAAYVSNPNNYVYTLALQPDGQVIAGGEFTVLSGASANHLARVQTTGVLDPTFDIGTGANAAVITLTLLADGNVLAGGTFTQFNGLGRSRLVRIRAADNVVAVPYRFTKIESAAGQIRLSGTVGVGQRYVLEYSRDLKTWFELGTTTATGPTLDFTDPNPTDDYRSYRVRVK